ncbi:methyl-accepting chemotaxis protein [Azotobacter vinelandii]|uniref:methyl-accepting chemotaxis protein n=2 Tax=Azotobacter vinelandii TaxID=354 RepID=UPI0026654D71|nr:methyl-accepting chemotaxis protein [Azotobacter vinelandii]WKN24303.1 methyl-accepting chemotaxis protein [Azotobacter vinelandii]
MGSPTTSQKLWGTLVAAWLAMLVLVILAAWIMRGMMFEERRAKVESQVEIALSALGDVVAQVERGAMSREEGQARAAELVKSMRYDDGRGYFFVFDADMRNIAHPTIEAGARLSEFKDAGGRNLFVGFANAVDQGRGRAYFDYPWRHGGTGELESKSSFIRLFEPWGWYVGSGIYIADIDEMFVKRLIQSLVGLLLAGAALSLAMGWVIRDLMRNLGGDPRYAVEVVGHIADGDLTHAPVLRPGDSDSVLAHTNRMREALAGVIGDIGGSARQVEAEAEAIGAGNAELAARTEQQAAALAETASTMEQLTATVRQNAENAGRASALAENCAASAHKGGGAMQSVVDIMAAIQVSAERMSGIVDTIDSIAFQTNILALNASVEAARAGEQGRGFAVVAGEVRNLASRSAEAAREIKGLIDGAGGQVQAGNQQVRRTGELIQAMVADIGQLNRLIGEISSASAEQSSGIEQVNLAVAQMDQMTQRNAGMVQDSAQATQRLARQSVQLNRHVVRFVIEASQGDPRGRKRSAGEHHQQDGAKAETAWS